jgi:uncharacterized membrane protein
MVAVATRVDVDALHTRAGHAGHVIHAVSVAGLGAICLWAGSLGAVFVPVPRWVPLRRELAYASGVFLIAAGLALLARRTARRAALALTVNFAVVWLLLCHVPATFVKPGVDSLEGCGLNMTVAAGSWILLALSTGPLPASGRAARLFGESGARIARRVYALGLPLIGLAHFADAHGATEFVPAWLPLRVGLVYFTGAAHVAAALAILAGVLPRIAAVLEAVQISAFVIVSHLPAVYRAPGDKLQWAMLVNASVIAGSAWLVAATFGGGPRSSAEG